MRTESEIREAIKFLESWDAPSRGPSILREQARALRWVLENDEIGPRQEQISEVRDSEVREWIRGEGL